MIFLEMNEIMDLYIYLIIAIQSGADPILATSIMRRGPAADDSEARTLASDRQSCRLRPPAIVCDLLLLLLLLLR